MQIPEYLTLCPSAPKDDDLRTCQHSRMKVPSSRRSARDLWLGEFVGVDIQDVGVVEVRVTLRLTRVVVPSEDDDAGS